MYVCRNACMSISSIALATLALATSKQHMRACVHVSTCTCQQRIKVGLLRREGDETFPLQRLLVAAPAYCILQRLLIAAPARERALPPSLPPSLPLSLSFLPLTLSLTFFFFANIYSSIQWPALLQTFLCLSFCLSVCLSV